MTPLLLPTRFIPLVARCSLLNDERHDASIYCCCCCQNVLRCIVFCPPRIWLMIFSAILCHFESLRRIPNILYTYLYYIVYATRAAWRCVLVLVSPRIFLFCLLFLCANVFCVCSKLNISCVRISIFQLMFLLSRRRCRVVAFSRFSSRSWNDQTFRLGYFFLSSFQFHEATRSCVPFRATTLI